MGRVYLAQHVRLPQQVAIKVLRPTVARDPAMVERFCREARNASQIENEHVAHVSDFGETGDGVLYLVMEYVEGESLSKIIEREGALAPARVADITCQAADALAAAHERPQPIVHRDLKPDNIILGTRRDGADRVKVIDFGIAEAMHGEGPRLTQTGFLIGTPEYMSPEQLSAMTLDWRSDIYSLALVAFAMLTGCLPFSGTTPQEAAFARLRDRPRTLAEMKGDVEWPPALQAVLDRALCLAPANRYDTAPEFARALSDAIADWQRTTGTRTGTGTNASTPARGPILTSAAVLGVLTLIVAGLYAARRGTGPARVAPRSRSSAEKLVVLAPPDPGGTRATTPGASNPGDHPGRGDRTATAGTHTTGAQVVGVTPPSSKRPTPTPRGANVPVSVPAPRGSRATLDYLNGLRVDARSGGAAGQERARAVLDSVPTLLSRLTTRRDTVELGVYAAAAYVLLGQQADACGMLGSIDDEASAIARFEQQIRLWRQTLDCQ